MSKQTIIVVVLLLMLLAALSYIGYGYYSSKKLAEQQALAQYGYQYGYQQAVIDAAQLAVTCQAVPLRIGNQTINMVAVDCLQQQKPAAQ